MQSINGGIVIADFNLDGKNDLAWKQGYSNDDVHIRLNTNNGGALTATDFGTEIILDSELLNYGAISIGDINGDGKPDILISDSRQVGVFENNFTSGQFTTESFIPSHLFEASGNSTYPTGIIAADLNGDQKPEMVVGITNTNPVRILLYENKNIHAPVISLNTVSPLAAPVGATVTITGNNFSTTPSENKVWFGAVEANVLSATANLITAQVPPGASYAPVSVTKNELTSRYHLPFQTTFSRV
ncbi:MAG: VCBS repeat-containing protein [Flammeovirgaceae bacterium]|nr:VCBS repeat-containing protein [Flammeovirgaceae bacterium]